MACTASVVTLMALLFVGGVVNVLWIALLRSLCW